MARLEDIRRKLYAKDFPEQPRLPRETPPRRLAGEGVEREWRETEESKTLLERSSLAELRERRISRRLLVAILSLVFLGAAGFVGYTLYLAPGEVALSVLGLEEVTAGEVVTFMVQIENGTRVALREGLITLALPAGAMATDPEDPVLGPLRRRIPVADVPPGGKHIEEVRLRLFGSSGERQTISATYRYRPENIQSELLRTAEFTAAIGRVPVVLSIEAPERVGSGQEVAIAVAVDSEASVALPDLALGIEFPPGFTLTAADPPSATGTERIWLLGPFEPGAARKVTLRGKLSGEPEEAKLFPIRVGRYDAAAKAWLVLAEGAAAPQIASPFLFVRTTVGGAREGTLNPGERVSGSVFFRNSLPQKIENLSVVLAIPEALVALESVRPERGFYDVSRRALAWNPASEPRLRELAPGEEGTLAFSFQVKDPLPIRSFTDKNFVLGLTAVIDSLSPPPEYRGALLRYEDRVAFKLASRLALAARSAFYDSPSPNSGPLPPKVREATSYSVWLQLASGANDLRDVEVRGELAGGVEWKGPLRTDLGEASFNPASREFVWRIRELRAATGVLRPQATAVMQVAFTPADNQTGTVPNLIKHVSASGRDSFTGGDLRDTVRDLTTELRDDPRSNFNEWRVVE
ncbi:MAG: hypothetical protein A3B37_00925 [Candidatus Sungbacteria bacterium RIFCSPLOWO2_01_FULL_59_16]|uniref:DUF11 domain-containing protein n=1 Tax=Candidatus Sungbacteria bacterium RIFCSPLOWO2_01_FULL_59_16 TaxID=1802280 RepID=A0A1G2LE36_9BACT|nr:MAG: hypothetical protein A3B37_00925 [Candidatus Sungbacteria bacterium RIFCSPLOWO2_01_FULL_59_16]